MQEVFKKIIVRLYESGVCSGNEESGFILLKNARKVVGQAAEGYDNGWIPCSEYLPDEPEPNPLLDNKPLEFYLVTERNADYAFRAFWNGKSFTDGWSKLDVIAWQPLPQPYEPKESEMEDGHV
jgi:hypothetical protein